jgi:hypothetical protein
MYFSKRPSLNLKSLDEASPKNNAGFERVSFFWPKFFLAAGAAE